MKIKIDALIIFSIFILTAIGLFTIKNKAESISNQLVRVKKQISEEKSKIYLLKAEIEYLTSPNVLRRFANNNLSVQVVELDNIIEDPLTQKIANFNKNILLIKTSSLEQGRWRFKKSPNKYLQQTAMRK